MAKAHDEIGFGGGCHWCTEAVFQFLKGTCEVKQGFVRSEPPHDQYSEAVVLKFDEEIISLGILIEIHLRTHASTSNHKMRGKYRSAIYVNSDQQRAMVTNQLSLLQNDFEKPLVTNVLPLLEFDMSAERFQNYYRTDPARPFCKAYIDPKLALLRREFGTHLIG